MITTPFMGIGLLYPHENILADGTVYYLSEEGLIPDG